MEWFEKLKRAKELLDGIADKGADYVRNFAEFLREVADASEKSADAFDPTPPAKPGQPEQQVALGKVHEQELDNFLKECENQLSQPRTNAEASSWQEIGLTLLIELVKRIIEKRRNRP